MTIFPTKASSLLFLVAFRTSRVFGDGGAEDLSSTGLACDDSARCESGACGVDGRCAASKIADGDDCRPDDGAACASGACGRAEVADDSPNTTCCASGRTVRPSWTDYDVCTELPVGARCRGVSFLCASDVCGPDLVCAAEKFESGAPCEGGGYILGDDVCASGACGRREASRKSKYVCCDDETKTFLGDRTSGYVCGSDLPKGAVCEAGGLSVCRSRKCRDGVCSGLSKYDVCDEDDDCENGACGVLNDERVCCPSGKHATTAESVALCTATAYKGEACSLDAVCVSNVCVQGTCLAGLREEEGDTCESDRHCVSGECADQGADGVGSCAPFPSIDAKNTYLNAKAVCPFSSIVSDSSSLGNVEFRVYGDESKYSYTSTVGTATESNVDDSATNNLLVGEELVLGIQGCADGDKVLAQRRGDRVCFSYQREDFDGDDSVYSCEEECVLVAGTGSFQTYDKRDSGSFGGMHGVAFTTYLFTESRKCRVEVGEIVSQDKDKDTSNLSKRADVCSNLEKLEQHMLESFTDMMGTTSLGRGADYECGCDNLGGSPITIDCTLEYVFENDANVNSEQVTLVRDDDGRFRLSRTSWSDSSMGSLSTPQEVFQFDEDGVLSSCSVNGCSSCSVCADKKSVAVDCGDETDRDRDCAEGYTGSFANTFAWDSLTARSGGSSAGSTLSRSTIAAVVAALCLSAMIWA